MDRRPRPNNRRTGAAASPLPPDRAAGDARPRSFADSRTPARLPHAILVHSLERVERHVDSRRGSRCGPRRSAHETKRNVAHSPEILSDDLADLPFPRVAPVTKTPSSYVRLTAAPSILSSTV